MNWNIKVIGRWCIAVALCAYGVVVFWVVRTLVLKDIADVKDNLWSYLITVPALLSPIAMGIRIWPRAKFKARVRSCPRTAEQIEEALLEVIRFIDPRLRIALYEDICDKMKHRYGFSERKTRRALDAPCKSQRLQMSSPHSGAKGKHCLGTRYQLLGP